MIAYLDPSALARAYLVDEEGHVEAKRLLGDNDIALVTGTWTRLQVGRALRRAVQMGQGDDKGLLSLLDADLGASGPVAVVGAPEDRVVEQALRLVHRHGLPVLAAYHVATAVLALPPLAEPSEALAYASHNQTLLHIAAGFGLKTVRIGGARKSASARSAPAIVPLRPR